MGNTGPILPGIRNKTRVSKMGCEIHRITISGPESQSHTEVL